MTELVHRRTSPIDEDTRTRYAGYYVMKLLDLEPADGGMRLPVVMPSELSPLESILHELAVEDLVEIHSKSGEWRLTKKGLGVLAGLIDEATALIDEFDDDEPEDVVEELRRRNLDPYRARFLWGWVDGEFDDLVAFQEQRGVRPVERLWAYYLISDEFWAELAREVDAPPEGPARAGDRRRDDRHDDRHDDRDDD
jgi:hypothetical protein